MPTCDQITEEKNCNPEFISTKQYIEKAKEVPERMENRLYGGKGSGVSHRMSGSGHGQR